MIKCVVIVFIVQALVAGAIEDNEVASDQKIVHELPCLAAGGICVRQDDCPRGKTAALRGLCPLNQDRGYECCYSVPLSETRCRGLGGECMAHCAAAVRLNRAADCVRPTMCCRLE